MSVLPRLYQSSCHAYASFVLLWLCLFCHGLCQSCPCYVNLALDMSVIPRLRKSSYHAFASFVMIMLALLWLCQSRHGCFILSWLCQS